MPSLWKKIKTKLGKKKKDKPLKDVGETGYMQPMSERLTGYSVRMEDNWRPGASPGSWNHAQAQEQHEQHRQSPLRETTTNHAAAYEYDYDPEDAFSTMDGLLHSSKSRKSNNEDPASKDLSQPPPARSFRSVRSRSSQQNRHTHIIRSIDSLSTISGDRPSEDARGTAASISQVDELVRRSLVPSKAASGRRYGGQRQQRQRVTNSTATKVNVIPVGVVTRTSQPLHLHQSLVASPFSPPIAEEHHHSNSISYVTASPPPIPQSAAPVDEPVVFHSSPSPISRSEQLGLDIIGASKASLVGSTPESRRESVKSLSPKILSPIANFPAHSAPAAPIEVTFAPEPEEFDPEPEPTTPRREKIASGDFSRTNTSNSVRSRTYQHALNHPVPLPDPLDVRTTARLPARMPTAPPQPWVSSVQLEESRGIALADAEKPMYGTYRPVEERLYWTLPPEHDPRVVSLLMWIERLQASLANLAVHKFLETRSRGALFVNVDYRMGTRSLTTPAVDWVTFQQSQQTLDRILQENIATYDPTETALVCAFLVSKSGNSLGIWLRKLAVPEAVRQAEWTRIEDVRVGINPDDLLVHVEATPDTPPGTKIYHRARAPPGLFAMPAPRPPPPPAPDSNPNPALVRSKSTHVFRTATTTRTYNNQHHLHRQPTAPIAQVTRQPTVTLSRNQSQNQYVVPDPITLSPPIVSMTLPPPARNTAFSTIKGSRVHVFGDDHDRHRSHFQERRIRHESLPPPVPERGVSLSSSSRTTLSGVGPVPFQVVEVADADAEPKKRSRWKKMFGIGGAKKKKMKAEDGGGGMTTTTARPGEKPKGRLRKKSIVDVDWD